MRLKWVLLFFLLLCVNIVSAQRLSLSTGVNFPYLFLSTESLNDVSIKSGQYYKGGTSYYFNDRMGLELNIVFQTNNLEWLEKPTPLQNNLNRNIEISTINYDTFVVDILLQYSLLKWSSFDLSVSTGMGMLLNYNEKEIEESMISTNLEFVRKATPVISTNLKFSYFPKRYLGLFVDFNAILTHNNVQVKQELTTRYTLLFTGVGVGIIFGG
ncbi:MAG: hypothetical protein N4A37_00320 [Prolixibacteraceae bacterium]|jgi:hypothetical protein|nr:hypothetical protein [Prolixibacteraceae bacterium]